MKSKTAANASALPGASRQLFGGKKPEVRRPKTERNPKTEARNAITARETVWISDFGLRIYAAPAISIFVQSGFSDALQNFVFRLASRQLYLGRD
ncbi:MAG: hypothetical protein ACLPYZ_18005 [Limisphaerales bacterium]